MRASDRLDLINKLGRELQSRYRYEEIDTFLAHYGVKKPERITTNSKWVYSKEALAVAPTTTLLKMAEELEVEVPRVTKMASRPPRNWDNDSDFRLFISHLSRDKDKATRLKTCFSSYGINGFVGMKTSSPRASGRKKSSAPCTPCMLSWPCTRRDFLRASGRNKRSASR